PHSPFPLPSLPRLAQHLQQHRNRRRGGGADLPQRLGRLLAHIFILVVQRLHQVGHRILGLCSHVSQRSASLQSHRRIGIRQHRPVAHFFPAHRPPQFARCPPPLMASTY